MSAAVLEHPEPWSEDEYFALVETANRIELIDGSLWVGPVPSKRHQHIVFLLAKGLYDAAERAGLLVLQDVNLRLAGGRILQPDIVVADTDDIAAQLRPPRRARRRSGFTQQRRNGSTTQAPAVRSSRNRLVSARRAAK
jgi:Uma2 family endonuclease